MKDRTALHRMRSSIVKPAIAYTLSQSNNYKDLNHPVNCYCVAIYKSGLAYTQAEAGDAQQMKTTRGRAANQSVIYW